MLLDHFLFRYSIYFHLSLQVTSFTYWVPYKMKTCTVTMEDCVKSNISWHYPSGCANHRKKPWTFLWSFLDNVEWLFQKPTLDVLYGKIGDNNSIFEQKKEFFISIVHTNNYFEHLNKIICINFQILHPVYLFHWSLAIVEFIFHRIFFLFLFFDRGVILVYLGFQN